MLRDNLVGLIEPMLSGAGAYPLALRTNRKQSSDDRPACLENPRPAGAESTLTENVASPFHAEPGHVVNDRHLRKRPMIFTTNKPLSEWGKVLHDEDLAAAILDRVLERGRFVHLDGPSGRTRHLSLEETLPLNSERVRISGINGSEFPEPTGRDKTRSHKRALYLRSV